MLRRIFWRTLVTIAISVMVATSAFAQSTPNTQVLVVDLDRVFTETVYGQRLQSDFREAERALGNDFNRIAGELIAEEKQLRDLRPETQPDEFREMAEAFDAKSTKLRLEQSERRNKLNQDLQLARENLLRQLGPIFSQLMQESGASILIQKDDQRMIVFPQADITQSAIALIDQRLGNGIATPEN